MNMGTGLLVGFHFLAINFTFTSAIKLSLTLWVSLGRWRTNASKSGALVGGVLGVGGVQYIIGNTVWSI
jgi:hypothetical protein